ncbi:group I intron-associated PD-(D/E)XK endonuclease [Mycobacterium sp. DL440]|uniref:group I intron-associated PD-(D/E)XK endonuclease n=1 Tax=Mycobacterium sp. DL440 TaxID=2675523 RepID=UPI0035301908
MLLPKRRCTTWAARTATDETSEPVGRHHTKDKGELGVAKAHADLVGKGFYVLFPATEHAPFDLVA